MYLESSKTSFDCRPLNPKLVFSITRLCCVPIIPYPEGSENLLYPQVSTAATQEVLCSKGSMETCKNLREAMQQTLMLLKVCEGKSTWHQHPQVRGRLHTTLLPAPSARSQSPTFSLSFSVNLFRSRVRCCPLRLRRREARIEQTCSGVGRREENTLRSEQ